ncbi:hypothetical protein RS694_07715 [Rhodoferax saidenbachensis]|uniref:PapC-like C-terminal domain-containing protein n=2 Tax=Rhodoferax saidenbachensis TaxID=1484693 RepID=A0A1P8K8V6_9BURK|nr:hypothetical protein RS694_07715 [Rhodoferax saidenbachensis]
MGLLMGAETALSATGLPNAPAQAPATMTLYLELVINGQASGQVVPVQVRGGHFYVEADVLQELHVRTPPTPDGMVAVDQIAGVTVEYDSTAQRLELMLPPDWLPEQQLGAEPAQFPGSATGGQGFLLNYDLYASDLARPGAYASIWSEQRLFGSWGVASNTGVYRTALDGGYSDYLRYDTRWTYSDPATVRTLTVGDLITGTLPWGNAVRMGGIQIARNFAVRPDLVPYPLPRFSGQATVPSAVDLFINGYKASSEVVQPGPFTLNTMPFINGAGEASVVTTDALGRQVLTTVPFYVSNTLLKTDTTDYSLALGALRQDYGIKNFSYGQMATSGSYRRGMGDAWTLEGRAELTDGLAAVGIGSVAALGRFGVVNVSLTDSHHSDEQGQQWSYGYQYNAQRFGFGAQHTQRNSGFASLGAMGSGAAALSLGTTQLNLSGSLGPVGSISLAYFDLEAADGQHTQIATLNFTKAVNSSNFFSVNLSHALLTHEYNLQLQWTLLLDSLGSVSVTGTRNRQAEGSQVQYSRSPPPSGGLGWNLSHASTGGQDEYRQASATWRAASTQIQAGVYAQGRQSASWAGATGSLVVMDGGIFPSNRINDAFALVSTSGVPGVPVRFENQLVGQTDEDGHLLVTGVNAYYPSRFEIDTLELPDFMRVPQTEQRIVLRSGSGAVLRFEISQIVAASLTLVDERGQPLPMGMQVQHVGSGQTAVLGWDGQVYLEGLGLENELVVRGANLPTCRVRFLVPASAPTVLRLGPLVCRPQASFAGLEWSDTESDFVSRADVFQDILDPLPVAAGDTP